MGGWVVTGRGVCNRSFSSGTGLICKTKRVIPEDPCDHWGGEDQAFQGAGTGGKMFVGFGLRTSTFKQCNLLKREMNFKRFGVKKK